MKHLVLGTAGHVDHGKTALVKALTGVDTDRLQEEKQRGITIVLGFAELTLPDGTQMGIVDVPGHERFINNMLAGIGGIDLVMLVIAADEGVMPQTREHFDICRLLNIPLGLTVITKCDLVDDEWLQLVIQDAGQLVAGTFLEPGGIFPVSAKTGQGMAALLEGLTVLGGQVPDRSSEGILRLPVDRIFTMKGFGTVVTGTLVSGSVCNGDTVEILPAGHKARVRGLQVHSRSVERAEAGQRTALNLQGIEREKIERGHTVTVPGLLTPTYMIDARISLLAGVEKSLKQRGMARFHVGATRCMATVVLLDREALHPGEEAYAQIRVRERVVAMGGDRFILRSMSENRTIGGGQILDPLPVKHKRSDTKVIASLQLLEKGEPEEKAGVFLYHSGFKGMDLSDFRCRLPLARGTSKRILQKLQDNGTAFTVSSDTLHLLHRDFYGEIRERMVRVLKEFHQKKPLEPGLPKAELFSRHSGLIDEKLYQAVLSRLGRDDVLCVEENLVRLSEHRVLLKGEEEAAVEKIRALYRNAGMKPPYARSLPEELGLDERLVNDLIRFLTDSNELVRIQGDLFMDAVALKEGKEKVKRFLEKQGEMSVPETREILNITRKFLIPLLEFFDDAGFTARKGDKRVLR